MNRRTDKTIEATLRDVELTWRENAGKYEVWWAQEKRIVCRATLPDKGLELESIRFLHTAFPFYQGLSAREVLSELKPGAVIEIGDYYAQLSQKYWKPWEDVGLPVEKCAYDQRYYWLEDFRGDSHVAVSSAADIGKVESLIHELGYKLRRAPY